MNRVMNTVTRKVILATLICFFVVVSGAIPAAAAVGDWYKGDGHVSFGYGLGDSKVDGDSETGQRLLFVKEAYDWLALEGGYLDRGGDDGDGIYAAVMPTIKISDTFSVHALGGWQIGEDDTSLLGAGLTARSATTPFGIRAEVIDADGDSSAWVMLLIDIDTLMGH
ncbi:MAG TPA: hypothetical protein EYG16_06085 [Deltaproteobacteria bacterium]|nr:hypothetical protein [Candidatus Binatota bacterium]HIL13222.1 hypothetical protein [Deltaproteobacteria bacterium]